jgi:hypothetical protein
VNAVNLFKNDANATRCPLVARKFRGQLFGPAGNDPKWRGNFVRNPHREGTHDRGPSGTFQALVTLTADIGDFQTVSQEKLLALVAHRQATEAEDEAAGRCHTQNQAPARPALAIALAFGTSDRNNSPPCRCAQIYTRQPRKCSTDGEPKAASLGWFQSQIASPLFERTKDFRRGDESPIGGMEPRSIGWLDKDRAMGWHFGVSEWMDRSGQVALDGRRQLRLLRRRGFRDGWVAKGGRVCSHSSRDALGQGGLFLRKIGESRCSFALFVDVGQAGDCGNGK